MKKEIYSRKYKGAKIKKRGFTKKVNPLFLFYNLNVKAERPETVVATEYGAHRIVRPTIECSITYFPIVLRHW